MYKYENVDIVDALDKIMKSNTVHYQSDFEIDKRILGKAMDKADSVGNTFLWISRHSGTHCLKESSAFLRDTAEHNTFRFHKEQTTEKILVYAVTPVKYEDGIIMGNIYDIDYQEHYDKVVKDAVPSHVLMQYEYGTKTQLPKEYWETHDAELGRLLNFEALPDEPEALQRIMRQEKQSRECMKPGDMDKHIAGLYGNKKSILGQLESNKEKVIPKSGAVKKEDVEL